MSIIKNSPLKKEPEDKPRQKTSQAKPALDLSYNNTISDEDVSRLISPKAKKRFILQFYSKKQVLEDKRIYNTKLVKKPKPLAEQICEDSKGMISVSTAKRILADIRKNFRNKPDKYGLDSKELKRKKIKENLNENRLIISSDISLVNELASLYSNEITAIRRIKSG